MDLRRHLLLPALLMAAVGSTAVPGDASAQDGETSTIASQTVEDGTITVIQPRPVLRRNRVDLSTSFGTTINTPLYRQYVVSGSLGFNIGERLNIAGTFEWFDFDDVLGGKTVDYEQMIETTSSVPGVAPLTWYGGLDVSFVPVFGKLVLFKKVIAYWDLELLAGGGVINSADSIHPAGVIGIQGNLYFNRWLSLNIGVRDRISVEDYGIGESLTHTATAQLGLTMFVPFGFRYRTAVVE
jgi:outer membrane beta-barrel protein